jgi:hypothetical protein
MQQPTTSTRRGLILTWCVAGDLQAGERSSPHIPCFPLQRKWLIQHGVVQTKSAKTRDDLLNLVSKNYYSARDTTYKSWSDSQLRNWAVSRGLIDTKATKTRKELESLVDDNYYSLRDSVYSTWDDNTIRSWLEKKGLIRTPVEAKRDDLLATMKSYFYTANDRLWDTWSDAQARSYLVKNKVLEQADAATTTRDKLEKLLEDNWHKLPDNVDQAWKQSDQRDWLVKNNFLKSDAQLAKDDVGLLLAHVSLRIRTLTRLFAVVLHRSRRSSPSTTLRPTARRTTISRGMTTASGAGCATTALPCP